MKMDARSLLEDETNQPWSSSPAVVLHSRSIFAGGPQTFYDYENNVDLPFGLSPVVGLPRKNGHRICVIH
jgi:hypothetical protein